MSDFFAAPHDEQLARLTEAGRDALRHWDIEDARLDLIKYRENAVFKVSKDDFRAALRLHRHGYHSDDALRSELQWMEALSDSGIEVPKVIPTAAGEAFSHASNEGLPGVMQVDLFEWIDGEQLGSIEAGVADAGEAGRLFSSLGELAAKVHNQAVSWTLPEGFVRHAWDADGIAGEHPLWGRFWEIESATAEQSSILSRARERIHDDLSALPKSPGKYSMIHADLVAENILVADDGMRLIDFDDAGFGWHMFELVTALYWLGDEPEIEAMQRALFDGYRELRALTERDLATYPLFAAARSLTYVGWVHTRKNTETAAELTPLMIELAEAHCGEYLASR